MLGKKFVKSLFSCIAQPHGSGFQRVGAHVGGRIGKIGVVVGFIVRVGSEENGDRIGVFHFEHAVGIDAGAAFGQGFEAHGVAHAVVIELTDE